MTSLHEVEEGVGQLPPKDLEAFRAWFAEFDGEAWDRQFEDDVVAGRLEYLAEETLRDLAAGQLTER